jgi:protein-disulfide isomerase
MTNKPKSSTTANKGGNSSTKAQPGGKSVSTGSKEKPVTSASMLANKNKDQRKAQQELKRKQAQQAQMMLLMLGAGALLIAVVVGIFLATRPLDVTFADVAGPNQYVGIPTGMTTSGPNGITYPAPMAYLGSPTAPVKLEEISSFSCPYCLQYHDDHFSQIVDEIKAGRAQYIYLPTIRTGDFDSGPGTRAAYCAGLQGQFYPMQDIMFDWQKRYGSGAADLNRLEAAAQKLNLDMSKYDACFNSTEAKNYLVKVSDYADSRGLRGTPTVFLFAGNQQIMPPADQVGSSNTPGSVAGLAIGTLRGIIEANALKLSYTYF